MVSCSEWCCKRPNQNQQSPIPTLPTQIGQCQSSIIESPPPAYELFAPPSYESLISEKNLYDIYVVPVHTITRPATMENEQPPQYNDASNDNINNCQTARITIQPDNDQCRDLSNHSHA